jgi:hypothetical protein
MLLCVNNLTDIYLLPPEHRLSFLLDVSRWISVHLETTYMVAAFICAKWPFPVAQLTQQTFIPFYTEKI